MKVSAEIIAKEFELKIIGDSSKIIDAPAALNHQTETSISWIKSEEYIHLATTGVVLVNKDIPVPNLTKVTFLVTEKSAKIDFSKILKKYFAPPIDFYLADKTELHRKNDSIAIGSNVFIGENVVIGEGTVIYPHAVILANTVIGSHCVINSHASIGTEGLGLELNQETNLLEKFPQLGNVIIEDYVEIGPSSTIRRGALKETKIGMGTKVGSMVNIGHNCIIGENCIMTCQVVTGGSSVIGNNVFMGVGSIVKNGIKIGSNSILGQGSVITKNVKESATVIGSPAEDIADYKTWSTIKKTIIQKFHSTK